MNNLLAKSAMIYRVCVWTAVAIAAASALFFVYAPRSGSDAEITAKQQKARQGTILAQRNAQNAEEKVQQGTWSDTVAQMGTKVLSEVSKAAREHKVTIVALRPQRVIGASGLTSAPYAVSLTGPFPNVVAFERALEAPATKIGVSSVLMSSTAGNTNDVTATIGIVAYTRGGTG